MINCADHNVTNKSSSVTNSNNIEKEQKTMSPTRKFITPSGRGCFTPMSPMVKQLQREEIHVENQTEMPNPDVSVRNNVSDNFQLDAATGVNQKSPFSCIPKNNETNESEQVCPEIELFTDDNNAQNHVTLGNVADGWNNKSELESISLHESSNISSNISIKEKNDKSKNIRSEIVGNKKENPIVKPTKTEGDSSGAGAGALLAVAVATAGAVGGVYYATSEDKNDELDKNPIEEDDIYTPETHSTASSEVTE